LLQACVANVGYKYVHLCVTDSTILLRQYGTFTISSIVTLKQNYWQNHHAALP